MNDMNISEPMTINEKLNKKVGNLIYWSLYILIFGIVIALWIYFLRHTLHHYYELGRFRHVAFMLLSLCLFTWLMSPLIKFMVTLLYPFPYILKLNRSVEDFLRSFHLV